MFSYESGKIDWCEPNYLHSAYIVEYWNSISNIIFFILGIYGFLYCKINRLKSSFKTMIIVYILIGVTSMYFHATLSLFGQISDEVSIYILIIIMSDEYINKIVPSNYLNDLKSTLTVSKSCLMNLHVADSRSCYADSKGSIDKLHQCTQYAIIKKIFYTIVLKIKYALLFTPIMFIRPQLNPFFLMVIGLIPIYVIFDLYDLMNNMQKLLAKIDIILLLISLFFWFFDRLCIFKGTIHTHFIFHIIVGFAGFIGIILVDFISNKRIGFQNPIECCPRIFIENDELEYLDEKNNIAYIL